MIRLTAQSVKSADYPHSINGFEATNAVYGRVPFFLPSMTQARFLSLEEAIDAVPGTISRPLG